MAIINPNWSRWIFASLTYHFATNIDDIPFYIEGQNREDDITTFVEFRNDGPYFNEMNPNNWSIDVLASVIIQLVQDGQNVHRLDAMIGQCASAFYLDIPLYKYGDGIDDDQTQFGCLKLSPDYGERIRIDKFGQTKPGTPVTQASVEARYVTTLRT